MLSGLFVFPSERVGEFSMLVSLRSILAEAMSRIREFMLPHTLHAEPII